MSIVLPATTDDPALNAIFTFLADVVAERKHQIKSGSAKASELEEGVVVFRRVNDGLALSIKDKGIVYSLVLKREE